MATDTYPISVKFGDGCSVETQPKVLPVKKTGTGDTIVLTWTAEEGAQFPPLDYFQWDQGIIGAPAIPQWVNRTTLQLTYQVPDEPDPWSYTIWITNATCGTQSHDPTIDNERPPGEKPKPRGGQRGGRPGRKKAGGKSSQKKPAAKKMAAPKRKPAAKKTAARKKKPAAKKTAAKKRSAVSKKAAARKRPAPKNKSVKKRAGTKKKR